MVWAVESQGRCAVSGEQGCLAGVGGWAAQGQSDVGPPLSFPDPERWTNVPLLVKILKLIINELSNVMEANAARQAAPAEWSQGARTPWRLN